MVAHILRSDYNTTVFGVYSGGAMISDQRQSIATTMDS